ncbi:MAG: hypothetical protein KF893_20825 [Caldilineaceae bacterium]|nr:hypothetical protein [Caldilineaceae bacterium]
METNETGKFFTWPVRWPDWRLPSLVDRDDSVFALLGNTETAELFDEAEMVELNQMAEDLAHLITPVIPDPKFRAELKTTLLIGHAQQRTRRNFFPSMADYPLRSWQVIATVPVLVGVAALIWRYSQRATGQSLKAA